MNLSQEKPARKQLNLNKLGDAGGSSNSFAGRHWKKPIFGVVSVDRLYD